MDDAKPVPTRTELLRRKKIRKFWADHPERREAQSKVQKQFWADHPERREAKSKEQEQFWSDHPERRRVQSSRQTQVMRDPNRRKINSTTMKRLKADPAFEARRLAGIRKAEASAERKASRRTTLAKTLAVPAIRRRRITNSKKATADPKYRAAMSALKTKFWANIRTRLADPAATATSKRRRGRPSMDERNRRAAELHALGRTWRDIARETEPDFDQDPRGAMERVRSRVRDARRSTR
jgi:hypothetical protein